MKSTVLILFFTLRLTAFGQSCDPSIIARQPGTWKAGIAGSVRNTTPAELAKEKIVLANIHKLISTAYKPVGCQALYSNVFTGADPNSGKNWIAGAFHYSIYVLQYLCDKNSADKTKSYVDAATPTTLNIYANVIFNLNTLYAAELADDDFRGYLKLPAMPVKKDGYYFMGEEVVGDSHLPKKIKEYRWLITYSDTLPFYYLSRKEYLLITKKRLEKSIRENGNSSGYYTPFMNSINDWLKKSDAELSKPAICLWNDEERFNGFVNEGTKGSFIAVKPNLSYYRKKLARSVPQFFYVVFKIAENNQVHVDNMAAIQKAVDFNVLKTMLGK